MSFSVTIFGPRHYLWRAFGDGMPRTWFYRSDRVSTGGVGFCVPGLHVMFMWGRRSGEATGEVSGEDARA